MAAERKTNLLILVPSLKVRGAETMMVNLAKRLDRRRFSVFVISMSDQNPLASQLNVPGTQFEAVPRKSRFDMQPARRIRQVIAQQQIDSILALDIFSYLYVWSALRGQAQRPKIFISIHNIRYANRKDWLKNRILARLLSGKERFLSVCNAQADYWSKTYAIPRERFLTIYNGVDTQFFSAGGPNQRQAARSALNLPQEAFIILQIASLSPEKRHEDSLAAFQELLHSQPSGDFYLLLVGDGPCRAALQEKAQQMGLAERVIFSGLQQDVKPYYAAADLFTLTSSSETFSVAALEALSMGLPCVLTDVGGAREMIVEGQNGYLAQAHNPSHISAKWQAVLKNHSQFDQQKISDWVNRSFSLAQCVENYAAQLG